MASKSDQFKIFKQECLHQIDKLGLKDWDVVITDKAEVSDDDAAEIEANVAGRVAEIKWNRGNKDKSYCDAVEIAKHEVAHLLLEDMTHLAESRWATQQEIDVEGERLATILGKIL